MLFNVKKKIVSVNLFTQLLHAFLSWEACMNMTSQTTLNLCTVIAMVTFWQSATVGWIHVVHNYHCTISVGLIPTGWNIGHKLIGDVFYKCILMRKLE